MTGKIGLYNDWEPRIYKPLLDMKEITTLWEEGVELGAHSNQHKDLKSLDPKDLAKEVISSRHPEGLPNLKLHYFSYPFGWFNEEIKNEVKEAGFIAGFSVQHGNKDIFEIRRIPIFKRDNLLIFKLKISGYYFTFFNLIKRLNPLRLRKRNEK